MPARPLEPPRRFRSHLWPRTAEGRRLAMTYVVATLLAQPPIVLLANRIEPRVASMPFLYVWLGLAYTAMIAILWRAWRRGF